MTRPSGRWTFVFAVALCACSGSRLGRSPLPDLPRLAVGNFLPAVREQVEKAYEAARKSPRDASANGRLGMILQAHGQHESAAVCYQRAHLLEPGSFQWAYYLAAEQASLGKNDQAATTLGQALGQNPDYLPAQLKWAEALLASGKVEESGRAYEKILKDHPGCAAAHYGRGRVLSARGQWAAAAESYGPACALFPSYGAAHYALALAYRNLGEKEKSQEQFQLYERSKLSAPPADDPLLQAVEELNAGAVYQVRRGTELERAGRLEEAAAAHERALQIDPHLVQAHVNLISLYGRLGRAEKAEQHYRDAALLNPDQADSHYNYGVLLFGQGKYPEAAQAFERALQINPFHAQAHNNLGYLREQQGRFDEAVRHYRQAIENQPDYRLAHFHLGRILVNRKNYREGIEHFLKTLAPEDQDTPGYMYALAVAYGRAGDLENALRYARKARQQAAAFGQTQLLAGIERDLQILEREAVSR